MKIPLRHSVKDPLRYIYKHGNRFRVSIQITKNKKKRHFTIGYLDNLKKARNVRNRAARLILGFNPTTRYEPKKLKINTRIVRKLQKEVRLYNKEMRKLKYCCYCYSVVTNFRFFKSYSTCSYFCTTKVLF